MSSFGLYVFDAYGTLFDVHSAVARHRALVGPEADRLSDIWRTKQLEYTWLRSLMGVHVDFWHVTREALDYALKRLEINETGLADELIFATLGVLVRLRPEPLGLDHRVQPRRVLGLKQFADQGRQPGVLGVLGVLLCLVLFTACTLHVRLRQRNARRLTDSR